MKRVFGLAAAVAGVLLVMSTMSFAADIKIGYVDFNKVQVESVAGKKAVKTIETMFNDKQAQLDSRQKELEKLMDELDKQAPMLSAEVKKQKEDKLQKDYKDLQRFKADAEEDLNKKKAEIAQSMLLEVSGIIKKYGNEEGYTLILERTVVLYAPDAVDITEKIIKAYDATKG